MLNIQVLHNSVRREQRIVKTNPSPVKLTCSPGLFIGLSFTLSVHRALNKSGFTEKRSLLDCTLSMQTYSNIFHQVLCVESCPEHVEALVPLAAPGVHEGASPLGSGLSGMYRGLVIPPWCTFPFDAVQRFVHLLSCQVDLACSVRDFLCWFKQLWVWFDWFFPLPLSPKWE